MSLHDNSSGSGLDLPRDAASTPLSQAQRIALGLLARGPLFYTPGHAEPGGWSSRAFPGEKAHDLSIRALVKRGHCHIAASDAAIGESRVAQLTWEGREFYRGITGRYAEAPHLPPTAERVMAEMQQAIGVIETETEVLMQAGEAILLEVADARAAVNRAEKHAGLLLARLRRLEAARSVVEARRQQMLGLIHGMAASPPRCGA